MRMPSLFVGYCCIAISTWSISFAADPTTLVIPKITKPLAEPVENDPLQAGYDKMWTEYEEAVQKATGAIKDALDKQIAKATDGGELDLVEMWEAMKKRFTEENTLAWDTGSKASVEWKKKNPKVPYPREFNDAVRSAANLLESAKGKLEEGYADLVKAYTKAKNVPRAKELRDEGAAVLAGTLVPSQAGTTRAEGSPAERTRRLTGVVRNAVEVGKKNPHLYTAKAKGLELEAGIGQGTDGYGFAAAGVELEGVAQFDVEMELQGPLVAKYKNSFVGLMIDFCGKNGYSKRVALATAVPMQDHRNQARPGWGTASLPDQKISLGRSEQLLIDLSRYAPSDWTGKAWVSLIVEDAGELSLARAKLSKLMFRDE